MPERDQLSVYRTEVRRLGDVVRQLTRDMDKYRAAHRALHGCDLLHCAECRQAMSAARQATAVPAMYQREHA